MSDKKKNDNDKNIIHFPELEKRKSLNKDKKREEKERLKIQKKQQDIEEHYRRQYRNERGSKRHAYDAMNMSQNARKSAGEKQAFIN